MYIRHVYYELEIYLSHCYYTRISIYLTRCPSLLYTVFMTIKCERDDDDRPTARRPIFPTADTVASTGKGNNNNDLKTLRETRARVSYPVRVRVVWTAVKTYRVLPSPPLPNFAARRACVRVSIPTRISRICRSCVLSYRYVHV